MSSVTIPQQAIIERTREFCREDDAVVAGIMYGSFVHGEGDAYSDVEFVLFFDDEVLETLDRQAWLSQIAPVAMLFTNEFGITEVIFENLVRGEYHFDRASELEAIARSWQGQITFPTLEATLVADKTGELAELMEPTIGPPLNHGATPGIGELLAQRFTNWVLFGFNVLQREEYARALELLWMVQRNLLLMVRVVEDETERWHIPSRNLEEEISAHAYARYVTCTSDLDPAHLAEAYREAWRWGKELFEDLEVESVPMDVIRGIDERIETG